MKISCKMTTALLTGFVAAAFATPNAQAQSAPVVNAPVSTNMVLAPQAQAMAAPRSSSDTCGLFKTCSSTKIGLGKGDFIIRLSALGVLPQDRDSKVWLNGAAIPGRIKATNQVMPELTFEYFFTDHLSIDLIAASTRHEVAAKGTPLGNIDIGSAWALPRHSRLHGISAPISASILMWRRCDTGLVPQRLTCWRIGAKA